jgi:site-specific recombinase XerD
MRDPSRVRVAEPLAPYARGFCAELLERGWAASSALQQMKLVACLSRWMAAERVAVSELTPDWVERFVEWRCAAGYRHFRSLHGLTPLLSHLRALGGAPPPEAPAPDRPVDLVLERYRAYLLGERGLAAGTVRYYERVARLFLSGVAEPGGELDLGRLRAGEVGRFVLEQGAVRSVGSTKNAVMALRSLLRFLHLEGVTAEDFAGAVPAVAPQPRSLPRALDPGVVSRLLASCDRRTRTGRRDFAVLIVLARLGLRAGEVAAIELGDIDWRRGELLVRGKGGRRERLPLPVDVGEALASYLRRGRPRVRCERLFLRVKAPTVGLSGDGVSRIVHAACRRCGLPMNGAHRLRHTAATETLRAGASLEEIGQLLRQQSTFTTAIYARVDRDRLRELARPWPGGVA